MAIETQNALSSADAELNQGNGSRSFDAAFQVSSGDGAWQPCPDAARQSESGEWWLVGEHTKILQILQSYDFNDCCYCMVSYDCHRLSTYHDLSCGDALNSQHTQRYTSTVFGSLPPA